MTGYTRKNRPPIKPRTLNPTKIGVIQRLEKEGWTVVTRGWPDMLAHKDGHLRFIAVKRARLDAGPLRLTPKQKMVATWLRERFGVTVEILSW